jgi:GTPase SAR1 family protein
MVYENDNDVKYSAAKDALHNNMEKNTKLIILYGGGNNGKTYLTNEMQSNLYSKNYEIYSPEITYSWTQNDFENYMESNNEKSVMHFLINPFTHWNIKKPNNAMVVDMNDIKW